MRQSWLSILTRNRISLFCFLIGVYRVGIQIVPYVKSGFCRKGGGCNGNRHYHVAFEEFNKVRLPNVLKQKFEKDGHAALAQDGDNKPGGRGKGKRNRSIGSDSGDNDKDKDDKEQRKPRGRSPFKRRRSGSKGGSGSKDKRNNKTENGSKSLAKSSNSNGSNNDRSNPPSPEPRPASPIFNKSKGKKEVAAPCAIIGDEETWGPRYTANGTSVQMSALIIRN